MDCHFILHPLAFFADLGTYLWILQFTSSFLSETVAFLVLLCYLLGQAVLGHNKQYYLINKCVPHPTIILPYFLYVPLLHIHQ